MVKSPYATRFTLYGERNMSNRKPFRTRQQRAEARHNAFKDVDGTYRAPTVRRSFHQEPAFEPNKAQQRHYARFLNDCM